MIRINAPSLGGEEKAAVLGVLDRGYLSQGPETAHLEVELAASRHAIATSPGTAALHLALLAHGIGPGDEVITTSFTFVATVDSILYVGVRPVFADVDASTFNLDPGAIEPLITPRTRAIMPTHLYGCLCDHGARARYEHERLGYNYRLSDLHAAIGRVQLRRQPELTRARARNAARLTAGLRRLPPPTVPSGFDHVWHQYTVQVPPEIGRDALAATLADSGIETGIYYRTPAHHIPYVRAAVGEYRLPVTEAVAERVLSLPVHPGLSSADLDRIVAAVNRC